MQMPAYEVGGKIEEAGEDQDIEVHSGSEQDMDVRY